MSTVALRVPIQEASPRLRARIAGVFEMLEGLTAAFGQVIVPNQLVVAGDAASTAANILGHEPLFRLGFASSLIAVMLRLAWTLLFYDLFRPVSKRLSLLAVLVSLVACALQACAALFYIAPLFILGGGISPSAVSTEHLLVGGGVGSLSAFTTAQLQALALIFLKLNGQAFNIYLIFFGLYCVLIGYLIFRSTFLPRLLGVLLAIDGLGWMLFLSPPLASSLFPAIATASAVAELPLQLWLVVMGVNGQRWQVQAEAALIGPAIKPDAIRF